MCKWFRETLEEYQISSTSLLFALCGLYGRSLHIPFVSRGIVTSVTSVKPGQDASALQTKSKRIRKRTWFQLIFFGLYFLIHLKCQELSIMTALSQIRSI